MMKSARGCITRLLCRQASRKGNRQSVSLSLRRPFYASPLRAIVKPFLLADIGEGIKEVQIIQWFVEPGARVDQFDKLCEVQSDKAATEITSRFDGVIKRLYYEAEDMAQVGKPLCDIDIRSEISAEDEALVTPPAEQVSASVFPEQPQKAVEEQSKKWSNPEAERQKQASGEQTKDPTLATPAVRALVKEININIADIKGTGRDGRVLKEDVQRHAADVKGSSTSISQAANIRKVCDNDSAQHEHSIPLTPIQSQMFKTMTRSLNIPHFLYADEINFTALASVRHRLNTNQASPQKLSYLPFIIKAVSLALEDFPLLNARVESSEGFSTQPRLIIREKHNIGVAVDTSQGLLVPNIKHVASKSISEIALEIAKLSTLAKGGRLSAAELAGGTITVSNIGSIGGTYVAPMIVQSEVAILGIGKARILPRFDERGEIVRSELVNLSWSADHRVVDGATLARMAEKVRSFLEEPAMMLARLR